MFETYKEVDEDRIGPEGIMKLCEHMAIEPTDVRLLVLAWQLRAQEQGYFSRVEWMQGIECLRVDSVQGLLERLDLITESLRIATNQDPFKDFYRFAFRFSRTAGQKSLEIETVKILLPMVLPPDHPHLKPLLDFLDSPAGAGMYSSGGLGLELGLGWGWGRGA
jgi:DCN1-like protein 4/5